MIPLYIFLAFLIAQRIIELRIARRHEVLLRQKGAVEIDGAGYRAIVIMHAAFLTSLFVESVVMKRLPNAYWYLPGAAFVLAQILRYWAISSLGIYWNTKIIVAPDHPLKQTGPYKFFRHPNYAAVIIEIAAIPLIFSCYITCSFFTIINAILIRRRISIEEAALMNRNVIFENKKTPDGITT